MSELTDQIARRRAKLEHLRSQGVDPYPPRTRRTHTVQEALDLFLQAEAQHGSEAHTAEMVTVAGRVTALRGMGRATFTDIRDASGRLQLMLSRDALGRDARGEEQYKRLKLLDLGDFIEATGTLFRTKRGEVTLMVSGFALLAKALQPLPEKWHGLRDVEKRYRQRHLDLIANEESRRVFLVRSRIMSILRRFLDGHGFLEVETPILVPVPAGAMARPFATHHHALDRPLFLRIATELYLKRLIVGGLDRVYELGRVFRNEGIDHDHNPEFTLLEVYQAYADYTDMMRLVEDLMATLARETHGSPQVPWGQETIDFSQEWRRVSLVEEVERRSGIALDRYPDAPSLASRMAEIGIVMEARASRGRLIDKLISATVEPHLIQPTFLVDYPIEMSPLAKEKEGHPRLVERFEGFIAGMEVANAFTELNDPQEQRRRMEAQERLHLECQGEDVDRLDEDFLAALEHGMPPTGGLGMGIDRLVMLLANQPTIREVILFPQLRT